jgi:hypothetical protein
MKPTSRKPRAETFVVLTSNDDAASARRLYKSRVNGYGETSVYKRDWGSSFLSLRPKPRPTGTTEVSSGPGNRKRKHLNRKWLRTLFLHDPLVHVVDLVHPQLSPLWLLPSSHEHPRAFKGSFFLGGKQEHGFCFVSSQVPEPSDSTSPVSSNSRIADYSMYSTFLGSSSRSNLFNRSNLLKRKDLYFSCLRLGLIRHRRRLRSSHLFSSDCHDFRGTH